MNSVQFDIWAVLFIVGAFQGYFISIVLFSTNRGRKAANICLGLLIFLFSMTMFAYVLGISGLYERWPHLFGVTGPLWYLLGPLFYFYIKLLLYIPIKISLKYIIHVIPAIINLSLNMPFYILDADAKLAFFSTAGPSTDSVIGPIIFLIQVPTYLLLSIRIIREYESQYKNSESNSSIIHIGRIQILLLMIITPVIHDFIIFILKYTNNYTTGAELMTLNYSTMIFYTLMIQSFAYFVIRQPDEIFPALVSSADKYKTSTLRDSDKKEHLENLHILMNEEKPFLEPNLNRSDLATMLSISPHNLSQLLNQDAGLSFYEFVNNHRINEVKKRLVNSEYENYTVLAIALDVGFNSKSSFNRIFKQQTGVTPSSFVKMHNAADNKI